MTYIYYFVGYIHRLRGYHGLDMSTYYHTTNHVFELQKNNRSMKYTQDIWIREWRHGWTDDSKL